MKLTAGQFLTEKLTEYGILAGIGLDISSTKIANLTDETPRSIREKILRGTNISWESPTSHVFPITLGKGVTLSTVIGKWDELKYSLSQHLPDVEMSLTKIPFQIELIKPVASIRPIRLHPDHLRGWDPYQAIVGLDLNNNRFVGVNLDDTAHTLVAGTTGSGKTTIIQNFLFSLAWNRSPAELELYLIDLKNSGISDLDLPHVRGIATEGSAAANIIRHVRSELLERNRNKEKNAPWIVLVVDEVAELSRCRIRDLFEVSLTSIGQLGRERRVGILAGTQKVDTSVLPSQLTQQFNTIFLGRVQSSRQGTDLLGVSESGAQFLPIKVGAFLMSKPSLTSPVRLTAFYPEVERWITAIRQKFPHAPDRIDFDKTEEEISGELRVGNAVFNLQEDSRRVLEIAQEYVEISETGARRVRRGGYSRMSEALGTTYGGSTIPRIAAVLDHLEKGGHLTCNVPTIQAVSSETALQF